MSLADLKELRFRDKSNTNDEGLPTLVDFLAACEGKMRVNVELKDYTAHAASDASHARVLRGAHFAESAIVSCLQLPPLVEIKKLDPDLPIGIILTAIKGDMTRLPVNFLSLNQRLIRESIVLRAHRARHGSSRLDRQ